MVESNFQDCMMLYDIEDGKYYVLNEVGSIIWGFLEEKIGVQVKLIIDKLSLLFPNENSRIESDAIEFIEFMLSKGIIQLGG